nr:40S ribosomal protein S15 [Cryptomonas sp.]
MVKLENLTEIHSTDLIKILSSRGRRKFCRGLQQKPITFIRKLRHVKKESKSNGKMATIRTHLRNMIIVPEMFGNQVGIYNGKTFNQIEIKPDMIGHYTGEFSITYKPVKHGRPGIGATSSSKFVPLK